jgi:hypothetical protein
MTGVDERKETGWKVMMMMMMIKVKNQVAHDEFWIYLRKKSGLAIDLNVTET